MRETVCTRPSLRRPGYEARLALDNDLIAYGKSGVLTTHILESYTNSEPNTTVFVKF